MSTVGLSFTLFVGVFILIGSLLSVFNKNNKGLISIGIPIIFGIMLGLIVFEMLPNTYNIFVKELGRIRGISSIVLSALIGVTILKVIDLFVPHHECEDEANEDSRGNLLYHVGFIATVALIIHNIIEGMGLYVVTSSNPASGLLLCLGIGLHNMPMGFVITSSLMESNMKRINVVLLNAALIVSTFLGGVIVALIGGVSNLTEGILLGITLGTLAYIVVFELAPQVYKLENKTLIRMCVMFGFALTIVSVLITSFIGEL